MTPAVRPRSTPQPTLGPLARGAAATAITGKDPLLRKLLILLAAYADAGEASPPVRELERRLRCPPERIDGLLKALIAERLLHVHWRGDPDTQRNLYTLRLARRS
ncbi:MAG: hypothetical protein ACYCUM_13950 [Solirubrobacteraceae bacterium]